MALIRKIDNRIEQQANDLFGSGKKAKQKRKTQYQRPILGTKLVREYKGIEYQVTILEEGYKLAASKRKGMWMGGIKSAPSDTKTRSTEAQSHARKLRLFLDEAFAMR